MFVSFYSYQGKPNEVPKDLGRVIDTEEVNLITDAFPCLNLTLEIGHNIESNYCSFRYPNATSKTYYWFIDDIRKFENIYYFKLTLDVIQTYWGSVEGETQIIERSSSLAPRGYLMDSKWKTGKNLRWTKKTSTTNPFNLNVRDGKHFVMTVGRKRDLFYSDVSIMDVANGGCVTTYAMDYDKLKNFTDRLWSYNPSDLLNNWFFQPLDAIMSLRCYPFHIPDGVDHVQSEDVEFRIGDERFTGGVFDLPLTVKRIMNSQVIIDLGTIDTTRVYSDFRDYPPYTNYKMFLPFVGLIDFPLYEYYSKNKIHVKYIVDLNTGSTLVCFYDENDQSVPLKTLNATIGFDVPLTKTGFDQIAGGIVQMAASAAITAAGVPFMNPSTSTSVTTIKSKTSQHDRGEDDGRLRVAGYEKVEETRTTEGEYNNPSREVMQYMRLGNTAVNTFLQPTPSQSNGGCDHNLFRDMPMVIVLFTYTCAPVEDEMQIAKYGKLVMRSAKLQDCSGFASVSEPNIPMNGMTTEIYNAMVEILANGIYIREDN